MKYSQENRTVSDIATMQVVRTFPDGSPSARYQDGVTVYFSSGVPAYAMLPATYNRPWPITATVLD